MKPTHYAVAAALWLAACDGGASAVPARDHSAEAAALEHTIAVPADPRAESAPTVDGRPIWSSNSRYTAEQNANYHFTRDGEEFGAKDLDDFVRKAHAFVNDPPQGAEVLARANGDRLIYDSASNTFAVATAQGAPRTMFKPRNGGAYWQEQKAKEQKG